MRTAPTFLRKQVLRLEARYAISIKYCCQEGLSTLFFLFILTFSNFLTTLLSVNSFTVTHPEKNEGQNNYSDGCISPS
jgi:hypothetical protein